MSSPSCRLCLVDTDLMSLLTRRMRSRDILVKIKKYLQLEITNSDGYSHDICMKCLSKIEDFDVFCRIVQNNQQLLTLATTGPVIVNEIDVQELRITDNSIDEEDSRETPNPGDKRTEIIRAVKIKASNNEGDDESLKALVHEFVETDLDDTSLVDDILKEELDDDLESLESSNLYDESECGTENVGKLDPLAERGTNRKWQPNEFPKIIYKGCKLVVRGPDLIYIMSRFYDLKCNLCPPSDPEFKCVTTMFTHYNDMHSISGYVVCCGRKFSRRDKMAYHMTQHLQPDAFTCSICKKVLRSPTILRNHQLTHLSESDRQWACTSCPRRFCNQTSLSAHLINHLPDTAPATHKCEECGKFFKSKARLFTHKYNNHKQNAVKYVCTICGKQFKQRGGLDVHVISHESHAHQVQCEQCGKWLKNKWVLKSHFKFTHSDVHFKCKLCDYSVRRKQLFNNHMRNKHSDNKPFQCEYCKKSFKQKYLLNTHIVQHTGEVKFACEFCGRKFVSRTNCYKHRKTVHAKEYAEQRAKKEEEEQILRSKSFANRT